jgi:hypothetical protein
MSWSDACFFILFQVPFFGSTRAAEHSSIPTAKSRSRPRAGGVKAGRHSARKAPPAFPGRALTAPSTAASCIGRDRKAPNLSDGAGAIPHISHANKTQATQATDQELRTQFISRGVVLVEAQKQRGDPNVWSPLMEKVG